MAFSAGGIVLASQLNNILTPGWTAYVPSWTGSGSNPVVNNGTLTGRYRRVTGSDKIIVEGRLTIGSTTTFGSGTYYITCPVTPSATSTLAAAGSMYMFDSGVLDRSGVCLFEDNTKFKFASGGIASPTVPGTWSNGDHMRWTIEYEPA